MTKLWRAVNQALTDAMAADASVVLFGQDVGGPGGPYGMTRGLQETFGQARVRDAPISEIAMAGCAVGAAMLGLRPVIEIMFLDFMGLALDQLVNNAAKFGFYVRDADGPAPLPLVVHALYGGRASMGAQHSQALEAWLCHVPGLKVVFPSTPDCAYHALRLAVSDPGPVIVIDAISLLGTEGEVAVARPAAIGRSRLVRRGDAVTVVAYGPAVGLCEAAIAQSGVDAELIDLVWLQPWDLDAVLRSVERTSRLVVVHDAVEEFGFGAEIAARIAREGFWYMDAPVARIGARSSPVPVRRRDWTHVLPDIERVAAALAETARN